MISRLISVFKIWRSRRATLREFRKALYDLQRTLTALEVPDEDQAKVFLVVAGELPQSALDEIFPIAPGLGNSQSDGEV